MTPFTPIEAIDAKVDGIEPHGKDSSGSESGAEQGGKQAGRPCLGKSGVINGRWLVPSPTVRLG